MKTLVKERFTVSPYFAFVLIHAVQFGMGYLSMATKPIKLAGQDAWIALILCSLSLHIVIWMMYQILNRNETDIIQIHYKIFGKAGSVLNILFIMYFLLTSCYQLRTFIEVIQVWLFPDLKTWALAITLLFITYYIVSGGFRVILGICMLSIFQHLLVFSLFFTAPFFHYDNLFPVMDHSASEILMAARELSFPFLGVEFLLFCYPYIKSPRSSQKWAHLGNAASTMFYLIIVLFAVLLFKYDQLAKEIWPALSKYKFVSFPFIERFEFIGITLVILGMFPIVCLCLWASSRTIKFMFHVRQMNVLRVFLLLIFIIVCLMPGRESIDYTAAWLSKIGSIMLYVYIPFVYVVDVIRSKVRREV